MAWSLTIETSRRRQFFMIFRYILCGPGSSTSSAQCTVRETCAQTLEAGSTFLRRLEKVGCIRLNNWERKQVRATPNSRRAER